MASPWAVLKQRETDLINEGRAVMQRAKTEERLLTSEEVSADNLRQEQLSEVRANLAIEDRYREEQRQETVVLNENQFGTMPTPFTTHGMTPKRAFGAQLQAVAQAAVAAKQGKAVDPRLLEIQNHPVAVASGASEGASSDGGFLVQTDVSADLFTEVHQQAQLYPKTRQTTLGANFDSLRINAIDETSRVDGSRWGGVQAYWTGEAAALTATKPKFRQIEMKLQKLTGLYYATDELLKDTDALGQIASEAFAEEFGFKIDNALMRGTGAAQPLGIIGHAGTLSVAKESGQLAKTILKENIDKMFAGMMPQSLPQANWYIQQDCWPQIFSLAQAVGIGGVPMFVPVGGMGGAPGGTLYGRPIIPIEQADTVGTVGDITFADWNQYRTIDKGGIEAATSIHVLFLTDEMTFRFILRMDGQPIRNSTITPFKGTNNTAPFVTLATRS